MHTILTKVVPDNLKACLRFVRCSKKLMYAKWIPSIEIGSTIVRNRLMK